MYTYSLIADGTVTRFWQEPTAAWPQIRSSDRSAGDHIIPTTLYSGQLTLTRTVLSIIPPLGPGPSIYVHSRSCSCLRERERESTYILVYISKRVVIHD